MHDQPSIIWRAVQAAGGQTEVGKKLGVKTSAPQMWITRNNVPAKHVIALCRLGSGAFRPHQIRPDIFPEEFTVEAVS